MMKMILGYSPKMGNKPAIAILRATKYLVNWDTLSFTVLAIFSISLEFSRSESNRFWLRQKYVQICIMLT